MTPLFMFAAYIVGVITISLQEWKRGWEPESALMVLLWPIMILFGVIGWGIALLEIFRQRRK